MGDREFSCSHGAPGNKTMTVTRQVAESLNWEILQTPLWRASIWQGFYPGRARWEENGLTWWVSLKQACLAKVSHSSRDALADHARVICKESLLSRCLGHKGVLKGQNQNEMLEFFLTAAKKISYRKKQKPEDQLLFYLGDRRASLYLHGGQRSSSWLDMLAIFSGLKWHTFLILNFHWWVISVCVTGTKER